MFILYILLTGVLSGVVYYGFSKADKHMYGVIAAIFLTTTSVVIYKLFLEQIIAKSYGGNYSVVVPDDMRFYGITWKDSDLWVGWYDGAKNECVFKEDSKFNILQGKITIKNCHPIALTK